MSEQQNDIDDFLGKVFEYILEKYSPAASAQESTIKMTTAEIFDQLQELCPSDRYSAEDVFFLLDCNNFKYHSQGNGLNFVWLLKAKV